MGSIDRNQGERCVKVSMQMWLAMLKGKALKRFKVATPIPDDAQVVRVGYDATGMLNVILRSKEWPEMADGAQIPDLDVKVETVRESGQ